jgi:hypothetical protein
VRCVTRKSFHRVTLKKERDCFAATGNVTFAYPNLVAIGSAALSSTGVASITVPATTFGLTPIGSTGTRVSAIYDLGGSSTTFHASQSPFVTEQVVNKYPTSTTITASANPVLLSQSVTFTATVTSSSGAPTGNVTFALANGVALGTAAVSSTGVASITVPATTLAGSAITPALAVVVANYAGSITFNTSLILLPEIVL